MFMGKEQKEEKRKRKERKLCSNYQELNANTSLDRYSNFSLSGHEGLT